MILSRITYITEKMLEQFSMILAAYLINLIELSP
jgi:hypothetical protein